MRKNKILMLLTFLFASLQLFAQEMTITGKVTDEAGIPLPGVNIFIKGTTVGSISDLDGNYTLTVTEQDAVLVYSYVGFATIEEPISGRTTINVVLSEEVTQLEEIMVIGYGTAKKRDLTGAISSVKSDEIENTGIGLSLVRKIVEIYGGQVWVESNVGQGSMFFFTLAKQETGVKNEEFQTNTVS